MTTKSEHNSRKSKLEPRQDDDDDELIRKMEEETNIAIMHIQDDRGNAYALENTKPPVQLAVDVQVEPCSDVEDIDKTWTDSDAPAGNIVTKLPDKIEKRKRKNKKKPNKINEFSAYIDTDKVFEEADKIIKYSNNPVDVSLAIQTKNLWGKIVKKPHVMNETDKKIQFVLNSWKAKDTIMTYKCYICIQAWWHLYPFREHIQKHRDVIIELEKFHIIANVIAYDEDWLRTSHPIHVHGNCYKCNRDFTAHLDHLGKYIRCFMGVYSIPTMYGRQEKCTICCYVGNPDEHYVTCHSVRSDLPIETKVRICYLCDEPYYVFTMHECPKKKSSMLCYFCHRHFGTGLCLGTHMSIAEGEYNCKYCSMVLKRYCMEPYHLLDHTVSFVSVELCIRCKGNLVFFSSDALRVHMRKKHKTVLVTKTPYLIIIPKSVFEPLEYVKLGFYRNGESTSRLDKEDSFVLASDEKETNVDPCVIKMEPSDCDDQGLGYEMLLSRVFNSSNTTGVSVSDIKQEPKENEQIEIENAEESKSTLNEINFVVLTCDKAPDVAVDAVECVEIDSDGSNDDVQCIEDKELQSNKHNTEEKQDEIACTVQDTPNECNTYESDDDVQIIEVKNEILEIEDEDIEDMDTESIVDNTVDLNQELNIQTQDSIQKAGEHNTVEKSAEEKPTEEIEENESGIEIEIVKTESEADKTEKEYIIEVNTLQDSNIPRFEIKIKNELFHNIDEVHSDSLFHISNLVDQDSDSDDKLHIATSDNETQDEQSVIGIQNNDDQSGKINDDLKRPRIYSCKCGYSARHMDYKNHLKKCTIRRRNRKLKVKVPKGDEQEITGEELFRVNNTSTKQDCFESLKQFTCTKCDKTFPSFHNYLLHFIHHGYRKYACPVCSEIMDNNSMLLGHVKCTHIKHNYFKSRSILAGVTSSSYLGIHCKTCRLQVDPKSIFKHWEAHLTINEEEQRIKEESLLEILENTNMEKGLLKEVIDILEPSYTLESMTSLWKQGCLVCGHVFKRRSDYKRHLIEHLLTDAQQNKPLYGALRCQICTHDVQKERIFRDHVRDHACLTLYKCRPCNREFSNSSNFSKHKKLHNPQAVTCDICKKKFHTKGAIEKHMIVEHLTLFKRTCKHCSQVFHEMRAYRMHLKLEHKPIAFQCSICKDRFSTTKKLWDHLWMAHHQRKVRADCFICNKQFRKFSDLKTHMRDVHKVAIRKESLRNGFNADNDGSR